jgi:hypothetical protein
LATASSPSRESWRHWRGASTSSPTTCNKLSCQR